MSGEELLVTVLKLGLLEWVYRLSNERWLKQYLRWRLVSRRFNRFILNHDPDAFTRDMFFLSCNLGTNPGICGHPDDYPLVGFMSVIGLDVRCPLRYKYFPTEVLRHLHHCIGLLGAPRLKMEMLAWRIARVRTRTVTKLLRRPDNLPAADFMAALSCCVGRFGRYSARTLDDPRRCVQCWRISRKRLACDLTEEQVDRVPDRLVRERCFPCMIYKDQLYARSEAAFAYVCFQNGFLPDAFVC